MATIVNARDVILQAASPRILSVSLPSNITSIPNTVTVTGYSTLGQIATDSSNAISQVGSKLNKASSDVLSGTISVATAGGFKAGTIAWDSVGNVTSGSGVAMTAKGIVGASGGSPTFSIDINGNAYYYGAIETTGDASFHGRTTSGLNIYIDGGNRVVDFCASGLATSNPANSSYVRNGLFGYSSTSSAYANIGVIGYGTGTKGIGILGQGSWGGGYFYSDFGYGIACKSIGGDALQIYGTMTIDNSTLVTNLNADKLDGNHASAFATSGHTHTGTYVQIASGRSNGDYMYVVNFSAPSNPITRAGWAKIATNSGGGGVWIPYYT